MPNARVSVWLSMQLRSGWDSEANLRLWITQADERRTLAASSADSRHWRHKIIIDLGF